VPQDPKRSTFKRRTQETMLSVPHMIVVFLVVLVVFGPQKLPELARSLGKLMAEFRKASTDFRSAFERRDAGPGTGRRGWRNCGTGRGAVTAGDDCRDGAQNAKNPSGAIVPHDRG